MLQSKNAIIASVAVAVAAGLVFATIQFRPAKERSSYVIEATLLTHYADKNDNIPKYRPGSGEWFSTQGRINDLSSFLAQDTGNHIGRPYLVFFLDKNATSETVRSALADLAKKKICYAGILDFPPDDPPTDHMAVVFRIVSVNDGGDTMISCRERHNLTPGGYS